MKLSIIIPENLNEVTLSQYQKWLKIAKDKKEDHFIQQKMIEIFCKIPLKQVLQIKANDVNTICEEISKLFTKEPKFIDRFNMNGKEFGFIPKLDDMSFGEYIDLDTYLNDWNLMHKAMGVLFRPITYKRKNQYLVEDYESSDKYDMKETTLDIVFGAIVFFYNLKNELQKVILNYLATQKEIELPQHLKDSLLSGAGINQYTDWQTETYLNMMRLQNKTFTSA
tara:strand:- start:1241 stop:1912 length:672 start_codon:yes stop_codon:yes gene_type:complete